MIKIEASEKGMNVEMEGSGSEILASLSVAVLYTVKHIAEQSHSSYEKLLMTVTSGLLEASSQMERKSEVINYVERQS